MPKNHRDRCEDAVAKLIRTYSDAADLNDRITALGNSGKILPESNEDTYDYLERLYHLAKVDFLRERMDWERMQKEYNETRKQNKEFIRAMGNSVVPKHIYDESIALGPNLGTMGSPLHSGSIQPAKPAKVNPEPKAAKPRVLAVDRPRGRMLRIKKRD